MASKLNLAALHQFASEIDKDPSILYSEELSFLRKSLSVYGDLKLPTTPKGSSCNHHGHDHEHSHQHSHEHNHEHSQEDHKDEEEEDLDRMEMDSEPYLSVPTGGEGQYANNKSKTFHIEYLTILLHNLIVMWM